MTNLQADLAWHPGEVPVSIRFDDPYFSLENGLNETRHVFLAGNDLPERFCPGFHIAELGFGTGLNMMAAWQAWERAGQPGPLRFTSFEAYPVARAELVRACTAFDPLRDYVARLLAAWDGTTDAVHDLGGVHLTVVSGDARATLPTWTHQADAWFLDGFAPAKNPELWGPDLLAQVARHTRPGGTAATYTAAGVVRRRLKAAGFTVTRTSGYGRKRHMTRAVRS